MLDFKGIARIFEEIELRLIRSLKRNIVRHKQEEQQEGFQWSSWQAEKLRSLDKFRRENAAIMNEYADIIDSETRQLMEEQFNEGVNGVAAPEAEQISETPQAVLTPESEFFGVDDTKVTKLIDDVVKLEKHAEVAALRTMDDVYRQTVNKAQLAMSTGSMTLQQAVDIAVKDFLDKGINCIVYRDGRRVNIADYVRMALRTTSTRAKLQGESAKYTALGYDTVQVSKYSMCSDTCLSWQGKAYINDVFFMWEGEIEERENGELWGKSHYCGKWFPLLSNALHGGLFHPNCRHTILLYRDGDPLPKALDNSEIEKRYKLEQKLRRLENNVRKAKRKAEGFSDPDNIKKAKKEVREAQKKLREFIDQVNKEYGKIVLDRDYGREKIYDGEVNSSVPSGAPVKAHETAQGAYRDEKIPERFVKYEKQPAISEKNVDNSAESGIIELERKRRIDSMNTVAEKHTAAGNRKSPLYELTEQDIEYVKSEIAVIKADPDDFVFNSNAVRGTCFLASDGKVHIKGNIFPDESSKHPRDIMSVRAVLAHEYYGHRPYRKQYIREDNDTSPDSISRIMSRAWADEFRASYMAAKNAPNLSNDDRYLLMRDALSRAEEAGVSIKYNNFIRRILYG